ncbi:MAG: hypothetical protein M0R74_12055, partial [Dehalococcoidia bacterium]|nr:hypothetical protein [Dehalococcoidia bacterium]
MNILLVEADDVLADAVGRALHGTDVTVERASAPTALAHSPHANIVLLGPRPSCEPSEFCATWRTRYGAEGPLLIATGKTPAQVAALLHAGADHALLLPPGEIFTAQLAAAVNLARRIARPPVQTDPVFQLLPQPTALVSR